MRFASRFAAVPWTVSGDGEINFAELEELARNRAIHWFQPVRTTRNALGAALGLAREEIFLLDLDDVEAIASDRYDLGLLVDDRPGPRADAGHRRAAAGRRSRLREWPGPTRY